MNIFWFRRDLRLEDNHALYEALKNGKTVPIFIFDTDILSELPKNDKRVNFIYDQLQNIQNQLVKIDKSLRIFYGKPLDIFSELLKENEISALYFNKDFEPYALRRDSEIRTLLEKNQIKAHAFLDHLFVSPNSILKKDGTPYTVFTPYSKQWKAAFEPSSIMNFSSENLLKNLDSTRFPFPSIESLGFQKTAYSVKLHFDKNFLEHYAEYRNLPSIPTSHLSIALRFGTQSVRKILKDAFTYDVFLNELIWREFFTQILFHFPQVVHQSFKPKYDAIQWRNNEKEFQNWKEGKTGYPIVDAGMRQLNETGFMHNRVRMITASFLCKHLLIDWRWGEAYFAEKLLDFELASNNGNWQWSSGSGCDAAPYFRVFNPEIQMQKFDPNHLYIKKWIPEWGSSSYPPPIVDHKFARERAIKTYKKYLEPKG